MNLVFVFVLASGAIFYQPQSEENCSKLEAAFANGGQVIATIEGHEIPILQGECIRADQAERYRQIWSEAQVAPTS
jgi:hypothetical protein